MTAANDYWDSRIQKIYDKHSKSLTVDNLYREVYERLHKEVSELYFAMRDRDLTRTELYKSAKFLSFRRDLQRRLTDISGSMNDRMSRALVKAYKDAGLAAKDSIGKKSVWTVQNRKMAEACVERSWAGDNFSGRIWKNRDQLAKQVEQGVSSIIITGMGRNDLLRELNKTDYRERFVPPAGASQDEAEQLLEAYLQRGRRQADCLVRTELMHTLNTAQIETYRSEGVDYLEFECEPTACPDCLAIAANNPYPINKIPCTIGHPNCRCTWLAVEDEDVEDVRRQYAEQRSEKTVDNPEKSDIIKEKSEKPITLITDNAINKIPLVNIPGYSESQNEFIQRQHRALLEYARDENNDNEVAFVFDADMHNRGVYQGKSDVLDFNGGLTGLNLLIMHNHPKNSSFSVVDVEFLMRADNVKTLTLVKNNGAVEYITKSSRYSLDEFKIEFVRLYKKIVKNGTDAEKTRFVKKLLSKSRGVIWSEQDKMA